MTKKTHATLVTLRRQLSKELDLLNGFNGEALSRDIREAFARDKALIATALKAADAMLATVNR